MSSSTQHDVSILKKIQKRLAQTEDTEPEQAIKIRLSIAAILVLYFSLPWREGEHFKDIIFTLPSFLALSYFCFASILVGAILINPKPSPIRRVMGMLLDFVPLSILMYNANEKSVFLFVFYLWVILGMGFRYGVKYLYTALAIALTGFATAASWGDFWQGEQRRLIAISLLFLLVLIPPYSAFLINKLHAAIEAAKFANKAKSRFLANISHELRTPLNGVIGMVDLISNTQLDNQQREFVNIMRKSANTLLELIENVLDISKIETGKTIITKETFDLHELINAVIAIQLPMAKNKGISVSFHIDARIPFLLKGDSQHVRQVLINIISNAIKFTEQGSVKLYVSATEHNMDTQTVRFEVQDTGIGIPPESISTVFEEFTQVQHDQKHRFGGTGLGTTISKELVELMGGEIGVESEVGKGTTFWFALPFTSTPYDNLDLSDNNLLLLASKESAASIMPSFNVWGVTYKWVTSSARAFSELMAAVTSEDPYKVMLIDETCISDIDPIQYAHMIRTEPLFESLPLVLINTPEHYIYSANIRNNYVSAIPSSDDKRLLFNAIHTAQTVQFENKKVVRLAEHYAKQVHSNPLKILIAEDNLVNQQVIEGILNTAGYKTILANTGEKALDILTDQIDDIDLVISDINMPEMSGIKVLQAMQYLDTSAITPVIILTADATTEAKQECFDAGAVLFLTKPINSLALLEYVAEITAPDSRTPLTNNTSIIKDKVPTSDEWIDSRFIEELSLLGGGENFILRLIEGFTHDGETHINKIKQAARDDYLTYRESLHALKGASAELGAEKLVELCMHGEALKRYDIGSPNIKLLCQQIEHAFTQTIESLQNSLKSTIQQTPRP